MKVLHLFFLSGCLLFRVHELVEQTTRTLIKWRDSASPKYWMSRLARECS